MGRDCKGYPKQVGPRCQLFEHKVLKPLGATHLILNIGWHSGLFPEANSKTGEGGIGTMFLDKVVKAAVEVIPDFVEVDAAAANSAGARNAKSPTRLFLPRVTWRATTAGGPFALWTERLASSYARSSMNRTASDWWGQSAKQLGYFDVLKMTEYLRDIQDKLTEIDKVLNTVGAVADLHQPQPPPSPPSGAHTQAAQASQEAIVALRDLLNSLKLHSSWRSSSSDTAGSREVPKDLKRSDIKSIFLDHAHPEPWVYAEIHNLFFNSICSLNTTS
jgi:hypothetical protein